MNYNKIHMIGIGGSSMSGIAEIVASMNIEVTGSDMAETYYVTKLLDKGFNILVGHHPEMIDNTVDLVVYSAAILEDDAERVKAKDLNIPQMERAEFLGLITKAYNNVICIAGTHGKSTTSGMIIKCFVDGNIDPTVQIGATSFEIGGNNKVGTSDVFILEACEYHDSYLHFNPKYAVILNVDADHLEYFGSLENVKKSFNNFAKLVPEDGYIFINKDDKNSVHVIDDAIGKVIYFSLNNKSDYQAINVSYDDAGHPSFDVLYNNEIITHIDLSVTGEHNLYDALATVAVCNTYGIDLNKVKESLKGYKGVHRRFEFLGYSKTGAMIYDDYAHHPTEIATTLYSVNKVKHNQTWALHQPFTYTRTKDHLEEFADVLSGFDNIVLTDIYAGREKDIYNIKTEDLVEKIKPLNPNVYHFSDTDELIKFLNENLKENDIICSIGCGPVDKISQQLVNTPKCGC